MNTIILKIEYDDDVQNCYKIQMCNEIRKLIESDITSGAGVIDAFSIRVLDRTKSKEG